MPKQIKDFTEITSAANADKLLIQVASNNTTRSITKQNLLTGLSNQSNSVKFAQLADIKTNNTSGGNGVNNTWTDRALNTKVFDDIGITLTSNAFVLPVGTYQLTATSPFYLSGITRIRIINSSTNTEIIRGLSEYFTSSNNAASSASQANLSGRIIVTNPAHQYKLQYRVSGSFSSIYLLGNPCNDGGNEVYSVVNLEKIS